MTEKAQGKTQYGMTKFSDLTDEEFRKLYLMPKFNGINKSKKLMPIIPKPKLVSPHPPTPMDDFDWGDKGAITPVYDQGQCGSCWAFSATETIESFWFLAGHTLTELSMQQIVDCDTSDSGCGGGEPSSAYDYVQSAGGIESYDQYPYSGQDGSCAFDSGDVVATISGYQSISGEDQMMSFVQSSGPLSVCVDASNWSSYTGGVMTADQCGDSLDHCVQLTGYSDQDGTACWNVRNSWGTGWGESGYIYLQRDTDTCGVADQVTYVSI